MPSWRRYGFRVADLVRRVYWFVCRPTTYGAKCVIEHDGQWLMIRNTYRRRQWTFPGGGIARGETAEQAVRREVLEEVGIELSAVDDLGRFPSGSNPNSTVTFFAASVDSPRFEIERAEIAEARWFDPSALPERRNPGDDPVIAWLSAGGVRGR